jgi:AraC-like DNA-binding protein
MAKRMSRMQVTANDKLSPNTSRRAAYSIPHCWRLQTAKLNLRETRKTIAQLAHSVGYESEEAFCRAFKREFGLSPARWRDQHSAE